MAEPNANEDGEITVGFSNPTFKQEENEGKRQLNKEPSKCRRVKDSAQRLQDATAPQTGPSNENNILRVMWIVAYIGLFVIFCNQTFNLGKKYLKYPTQVEIEIVSRSNLNFPAVTVCNNNPLRKSLVGRIRDQQDLILLDDFVMKSIYKFAEGSSDDIYFDEQICKDSDFLCSNGKFCVPEPWQCNGIDNCGDFSDEELYDCDEIKKNRLTAEENILKTAQGICQEGYVQCPGEKLCAVPCDNNHECSYNDAFDESVEVGCTVTLCANNLNASSSTVQSVESPRFGSTYPEDLNCTWTITAPEGENVQITFHKISIEGEMGSCNYDFVQLRDGSTIKSGVIKVDKKTRVCGKRVPKQSIYTSTSESLTILFRTDGTVNMKGFKIFYEAVKKEVRGRRQVELSFEDMISFDSISKLSKISNQPELSAIRRRRSEAGEYSNDEGDYNSDTSDYSNDGDSTGSDYGNDNSDSASDDDYDGDYHEDYDYDYDNDYDYDYQFMSRESGQFYGIQPNDYFSLYDVSLLPDFADFRLAIVIPRDLIQHNGHQRKDFIIQCTFDGIECSDNVFKTYQDPYHGNCFSFNSIRDRNLSKPPNIKKTSKTGLEYGLKLTLFADVQEYIGILTPYAGAKVLIHDSSTKGRMRAQSLALPAGTTTFLAVKQNTVERKGGVYSDCADDWPAFLELNTQFKKEWPVYSRQVCLELCVQNTMALECNCTDIFDKDFSKSDTINWATERSCEVMQKTQNQCKRKIYQNYIDGNLTCPCPQACHTTEYSHYGSSSPWPTEAFSPYLASKLTKSNSKRVQEYMKSVFNDNQLSAKNLQEKFQKNFARVEVYFEALNFERIKESPAYTGVDFLSDFGGNIGLWLGWSVLALFEVIQFFYECLGVLVKAQT